jgi:hypothetical protein
MILCRNTYFLLTKVSPGMPGLFGFVRLFSTWTQVFSFGAELEKARVSKFLTGALLACKWVNNR